jgi:hypothetical protein
LIFPFSFETNKTQYMKKKIWNDHLSPISVQGFNALLLELDGPIQPVEETDSEHSNNQQFDMSALLDFQLS